MDNKNFAIGVLGITTVIFLIGLMIVHTQPRAAFASAGPGVQSGDYVIANGRFLHTEEDLLYVIDSVAQRLIAYRFDVGSRQSFSPTDGIDLATLRDRASAADAQPQPQPRRGRRRP